MSQDLSILGFSAIKCFANFAAAASPIKSLLDKINPQSQLIETIKVCRIIRLL